MAKNQGTDLDSLPAGNSQRAKITDKLPLYKFPEKKWVTLRLFGNVFLHANYWIKTKKNDGKPSKFYAPCPSFDSATGQRDSTIYDPWRDLQATFEKGDEANPVQFTQGGYLCAISRLAQKNAPRKMPKPTVGERKSGFKEMDSESWTPVVPARLPMGALRKIKEQAQLNTVELKGQTKAFGLTHPKYGCDVRIMFDPTKAPADQYQVSIGTRTPLTEEELAYLTWDMSNLEEPEAKEETKRNYESWAKRNGVKLKSKKSKDEDEDDEDLPDDDGDDDEDDEPAPKKKAGSKSKPAPKKKPSKDEDDEDEDDFGDDDDDDDEDEEDAAPKSKSKPAPKKKSSKSDDDDEDDFGDDDDEDEDDEENEDEDDEDDAPKSKSKSKAKPAAKGKAKRPADDEDDEDEDDFGDDDDDDDEDEDDEDEDDEDDTPPPKSKAKSKPAAKPAAKKKPASRR